MASARGKKDRRKGPVPRTTPARLIEGWSGPSGTRLRLARPGEADRVGRFITLAGARFPSEVAAAIDDGTIAQALVGALEAGWQPIYDQLKAIAGSDDPPSQQGPLTTVLVAVSRSGEPAGAFMAAPPFHVLSDAAQKGLPADVMLTLGAVIVRFTGLAVDESLRGVGVGSSLLRGALRLYTQIGYLLVYGQFPIGRGLERYYPRFGFNILDPGKAFNLHRLQIDLHIVPGHGEQLMLQWI